MPASLATLRLDRPLQASLRFRVNSMRKRASAFSGVFSGPSGQDPPFSRCSFGLDSRPGRFGTAAQLRCSNTAPGRCHRTGIRPSANASTTIDNRDRPPLSRQPPAVEFCSRPAIPEFWSCLRWVCPENWTHPSKTRPAATDIRALGRQESRCQGRFLRSRREVGASLDELFHPCGIPTNKDRNFGGAHRYQLRTGATNQPRRSKCSIPSIHEPRQSGRARRWSPPMPAGLHVALATALSGSGERQAPRAGILGSSSCGCLPCQSRGGHRCCQTQRERRL